VTAAPSAANIAETTETTQEALARLQNEVDDLREWVTALAGDLLDRLGAPAL